MGPTLFLTQNYRWTAIGTAELYDIVREPVWYLSIINILLSMGKTTISMMNSFVVEKKNVNLPGRHTEISYTDRNSHRVRRVKLMSCMVNINFSLSRKNLIRLLTHLLKLVEIFIIWSFAIKQWISLIVQVDSKWILLLLFIWSIGNI